ncbi:hypothetical protein ZIOFF_062599 [Zingiber officinale]|uniref:Uncharacterized protein n=1 Tax=Zingiber officinale TaxID=94328 RepID=A0A8J5F5Q8_ZINOF|nr:hypothetical protein ZIOFF_062599 [Zingiber officinale]
MACGPANLPRSALVVRLLESEGWGLFDVSAEVPVGDPRLGGLPALLEQRKQASTKTTKAFCWAKAQTPGGRTFLEVDMLAVEQRRGSNGEEGAPGSFLSGGDETLDDEAFLDDINFGDLFMGIDVDGDVLPELELDPAEIFAEFPVGSAEAEESAADGLVVEAAVVEGDKEATWGDEVVKQEGDKNRKPSPSQGKRKAKWKESRSSLTLFPSVVGGLDAGASPEVRSGGGAAGDRQGLALEDFRTHGDRLPHSPQHRKPPSSTVLFFPHRNLDSIE